MIEIKRLTNVSIIQNKKNCSLTPKQFFVSFGMLVFLILSTSFIFWNIIIFAYAIFTICISFFFFFHHAIHTLDQEEIIIQQYESLTLKQINGKNLQEKTFPLYDVKIILENSKLYLFHQHQKFLIGRFLNSYQYPKYQSMLEKELAFRKVFQSS
jgi:uncharacterized membrane protein